MCYVHYKFFVNIVWVNECSTIVQQERNENFQDEKNVVVFLANIIIYNIATNGFRCVYKINMLSFIELNFFIKFERNTPQFY